LSIDSITGEILGRPVQPGIFDIVVTARDSGTPTYSISRTFNLLVIAPPQNDSSTQVLKSNVNETAQQIVKEITVDRIVDMISSSTRLSILETKASEKNSIEALISTQYSGGMAKGLTNTGADITKTELTSVVQSTSNNPNDKIISANANLNLDNTGQVNFDKKATGAFETVGLTIEKIALVQDQVEIKILDTRVGQKYSVTLLSGESLPDTLSFDPNTGKIKGVLPAGIDSLNISIKALSGDGTTRVLNLKIDLKSLKNNNSAVNGLSEQVKSQSFKMSSYGNYITSLFGNTAV
jgi:hypothetical protein